MTEAANNRHLVSGDNMRTELTDRSQAQQPIPAPASAMDHPDYVPDPDFQLRGAFSNQMIDAAMPLFGLVMRLRKQESHRDIPFLYNAVYNQVNAIVEEMRRYDYEPAQLQAHSYALCLYIDEAVMSTPWGKSSLWSQKPLLSVFHHETWGGEKIFTVLSRMMQEPKRYQDVLEFIYLCLCLGLRGKYGIDPKGDEALQALILKLREIILELRGPPPDLFGDPLANVAPRDVRLRREWPWWSPLVVSAIALAGLYGYYRYRLDLLTREAIEALNTLLQP
jgi:type VI secretion system protein ImpK